MAVDLESTPGVTLLMGGAFRRISEVSERCDVSADTLRYYERIGLLPPVNRNDGGSRDYIDLDIRRVEFINCMHGVGLPREVLIEYFKLVQQGDQTIEARKQILIDQRAQLVAKMKVMQEILEFLDYNIDV